MRVLRPARPLPPHRFRCQRPGELPPRRGHNLLATRQPTNHCRDFRYRRGHISHREITRLTDGGYERVTVDADTNFPHSGNVSLYFYYEIELLGRAVSLEFTLEPDIRDAGQFMHVLQRTLRQRPDGRKNHYRPI